MDLRVLTAEAGFTYYRFWSVVSVVTSLHYTQCWRLCIAATEAVSHSRAKHETRSRREKHAGCEQRQ